ncbi:unnamed protein product, partial [Mesorhabditis belari]|uniref:Uncharacterized protein n=2 Tax=Ecdysozoa TaxID=1206794 RepID=A0AAF3J1R9_9BILA
MSLFTSAAITLEPQRSIERNLDICHVCASPQAASPHFGAISCLACAAFFRRTVSLNITFVCKAENKCRIYYELRMICRACRYEKCLRAGMKRECVQKKRPPKPGKRVKSEVEDEDPQSESRYLPEMDGPGTPIIKKEIHSPGSADEEEEQNEIAQEIRFDCPASASSSLDSYEDPSAHSSPSALFQQNLNPSFSSSNDRTYEGRVRARNLRDWTGHRLLLHYMEEEHQAMDARRVMYSEAPLVAMVQTTGDIPFTRNTLTAHTLSRQRHTIQFEHFLSFQYARRLPGFHLLSKDEKAHLYKSCALGFSVLDMAWMTVKLREPTDRMLIFTDGTYSDLSNYVVGWEDEPGLITGEGKKQLFLEFNERIFTELIQPMHEMDLRDFEYAALKALTAWRVWYLQFTNTLQDLAKEHEKLILEGLIDFYKERNEKEFATRMGSILLLIGTISDLYRCEFITLRSILCCSSLDDEENLAPRQRWVMSRARVLENSTKDNQPAQATHRSKTFQEYLPEGDRTYSCVHCRAQLAHHNELISKSFQGSQGKAYLFNSVVNVGCGPAEERVLLTGLHAVADIYCECCKTTLGWKYEHAYELSQKYKEGKYIIELAHMVKDNGWQLQFDANITIGLRKESPVDFSVFFPENQNSYSTFPKGHPFQVNT